MNVPARSPAVALWSHPTFRLLAWRGARGVGASRAWVRTGWHGPLLMLGALAVVAAWATRRWGLPTAWLTEHWDFLVLAAIAGVLLVGGHRVRNSVFVPAFKVHGLQKDGTGEDRGAALAALVRHELAAITDVHRTIDEALPPADGRVSSLNVAVEDIGEQLEQTLVLPGLPPPWDKILLALVATVRTFGFGRGPQLIGNLHKEGSTLILTVELSGGGKRGSWRLSTEVADGQAQGEGTAAYCGMARQMAYQIAASLASLGTPRWEALQSFTDGLRAYRKVRLTRADREIELRRAEVCFRRALQDDTTFAQCHYNLGVVYSKLGERDAALACFRSAIEADPSGVPAYEALAMAYFDRAMDLYYRGAFEESVAEDFLQASVFAGRALALAPSEPRPWNVYGAAEICRGWRGPKPQAPPEAWKEEARRAIDAFQAALARAWRRLCRCELTGDRSAVEEARHLVLICLENLSEVWFEAGETDASIAALRQAFRLAPWRPSIRLALGKALVVAARRVPSKPARLSLLLEAQDELYAVHGDGLPLEQRAARWLWLLAAHSECLELLTTCERGILESGARVVKARHQGERLARAFLRALDAAVPPEELILATPERVGQKASPRALRYLKQLELLRQEARHLTSSASAPRLALVENRLGVLEECARGSLDSRRLPEGTWSWVDAQRAVRRARDLLVANPREAARLLEKAMEALRRNHFRQVRDQGLEALLARAYLLSSLRLHESKGTPRKRSARDARPEENGLPGDRPTCIRWALDYACRAVAAKPESAARRLVLADVHDALEDYRQGDAERAAALSLAPPLEVLGEPRTLDDLATRWLERLRGGRGGEAPSKEAVTLFTDLRDLLESTAPPAPEPKYGRPRALRFEEHAAIHFHLGRLLLEVGKPEEAAQNLRIASASGYRSAESDRLWTAGASSEAGRRRSSLPREGAES